MKVFVPTLSLMCGVRQLTWGKFILRNILEKLLRSKFPGMTQMALKKDQIYARSRAETFLGSGRRKYLSAEIRVICARLKNSKLSEANLNGKTFDFRHLTSDIHHPASTIAHQLKTFHHNL